MELKTKDYVLIVSMMISFTVAFFTSVTAILLPEFSKEFFMSNILQNWVATIYLLAIAILSVPIGKISQKFGLKKFLIIGIFVLLLGSIGVALSFSSYSLLFFRAFQGVGAAILNVCSMSLVVEALPPQERGKGVGFITAGVYIGLSLAPVLGGLLNYNLGWRSVFFIAIPLIVFILIITIIKIKGEWKTISENEPFDKKGSILFSIGIFSFIYGFSILNEFLGMILAVIGVISLVLFVILELKIKYPVFDMGLFKNSKFLSSNIASLISYFATFVITYILNYYLQYVRGMDSQTAGFFLIITPLMMAIIAPYAGRLSDKINPQKLAALGMSLVTIALFILCFLSKSLPLYIIVIAMFLQGVGYGLFSSPNTNAIMSSVPKKYTPIASASVATVRVIGQSLSLGMLTVIFAIVMGNVTIVPSNFHLLILSSQIACVVSTIACIIAIFASLVGIKSKDQFNIHEG